jgi:hypothetical protein
MDRELKILLTRIAVAIENSNTEFNRLNTEGIVVFAGKQMEEN